MLVICNGMVRSASTWSFNVAMELLRHSRQGQEIHGGYDECVSHFLESAPTAISHAVLKCHTLDDIGRTLVSTGAAKVIYTWREVPDAVASCMKMFGYGFEHSLSSVTESLELYRLHRHSGNAVILNYKEITERPTAAIERIATYLGLETTPPVINAVAEATSFESTSRKVNQLNETTDPTNMLHFGNSLQDPSTLLHQYHIRNGRSGYGAEILTAEQHKRVKSVMQRFGMLVS